MFNGKKKGEFQTRREFEGSLIKQMHAAFDFIGLSNKLASTFSGLHRIDQHDYPEEAIREALINAIAHRDYSFSGSIIVSIYDDRIEFVSLGGLIPGLQVEDLLMGVSQPRNEKLAAVFYRLKHIEAYGTGLKRIMQYYEDYDVKPKIEATNGAFKLTLPNMNYIKQLRVKKKLKSQHKTILDYLQNNPVVTNETVQKLLFVKQTRAYTLIREMVDGGLIEKNGSSRDDNEYVLINDDN